MDMKKLPHHHNAFSSIAMTRGYQFKETHESGMDVYETESGMKVIVGESACNILSPTGNRFAHVDDAKRLASMLDADYTGMNESLESLLFPTERTDETANQDGVTAQTQNKGTAMDVMDQSGIQSAANRPGIGGPMYDNDYSKQLALQGFSYVMNKDGVDHYARGHMNATVGQDVATIDVGDNHHPVPTYDKVTAFTDALAVVAGGQDVKGGGMTATTTTAAQQPGDAQPDEQDVKPIPPGEKRDPDDGVAGQNFKESQDYKADPAGDQMVNTGAEAHDDDNQDPKDATDNLPTGIGNTSEHPVDAVGATTAAAVAQPQPDPMVSAASANVQAAADMGKPTPKTDDKVGESAEPSAARKVLNTLKLMGEMGHDGTPTGHKAVIESDLTMTGTVTMTAEDAADGDPKPAAKKDDGDDATKKVKIKVSDAVKAKDLLSGSDIASSTTKDAEADQAYILVAPSDAAKAKTMLGDQNLTESFPDEQMLEWNTNNQMYGDKAVYWVKDKGAASSLLAKNGINAQDYGADSIWLNGAKQDVQKHALDLLTGANLMQDTSLVRPITGADVAAGRYESQPTDVEGDLTAEAMNREQLLNDQLGLKKFDESHIKSFRGLMSVVKRLGDRI